MYPCVPVCTRVPVCPCARPLSALSTGLAVMAERGETGPLRPWHLREAYRRLDRQGVVHPASSARRKRALRP